MNYWLMKSEPTSFSITALKAARAQTTAWDGVRNYQACRFLREEMKVGDLAFFYHSNCEPPGIVGTMRIVRAGYPDATAFDSSDDHYDPKSDPEKPRWFMVDVKLEETFDHMISLEQLRQTPELESLLILRRGNRLSVTPVEKKHAEHILKMAHSK